MDRETLERLAKAAGFDVSEAPYEVKGERDTFICAVSSFGTPRDLPDEGAEVEVSDELERFAVLVAEECAKVAYEYSDGCDNDYAAGGAAGAAQRIEREFCGKQAPNISTHFIDMSGRGKLVNYSFSLTATPPSQSGEQPA